MKPFLRSAASWLLITIASPTVLLAQVNTTPAWGNRFVEFRFDATKGTYSLSDKRDERLYIEDAFFHINQYTSNSGGYAFTWREDSHLDELGVGRKITIEGKVKAQPSLVLEVFIYDDRGAVALNVGVDNIMGTDYRVLQFSPLKATAYRGATFEDYKTLDGESGAALTKVSSADRLETRNNLLVTFGPKGARKHSLVLGGLTYDAFQKYASVTKRLDSLEIELKADDPVGKRIPARTRVMFKDRFYVDLTTDHRFEALEKYGNALRLATRADVSGVTVPILNFWYAFVEKFGGDDFRNNSVGTVEQVEIIKKTGFLEYTPVGVRLEPDDYALPSNQQGWWDDQHWQAYKGGQLLPPYETIEKWGTRIRQLGGVPFIYCQTSKRSEDYSLQFPHHLLFNQPFALRSRGRVGWWGRTGDATAAYWTYDYTDPGFVQHMEDVYRNLRAGQVQGIKFDYPETGWSYDGGFEDPDASTTSAYRAIFQLAYDGLGVGRDVQERIPPYGDIALGVVTTQRTEGDNDRVYPARISKTGLRWYKNRMVVNYDHDPINPHHVYPTDSRDGWQAAITMTATTSGRMEIGKYFDKMTASMLFDLSRAVPLLDAPTVSARPVDAFSGKLYPQVYDFRIDAGWKIITFYNHQIEGEEWPTDVMAYWETNKQFIPRKMIPAEIRVSLGEPDDEGGLGLNPKKSYYVYDFWNWRFVGKLTGDATLTQELRPGEARVMAVHEVTDVPQFVSTSRHLLQGHLDMKLLPAWNATRRELSGVSRTIAAEPYKIVVATNGYPLKANRAVGASCTIALLDATASLYEVSLLSPVTAEISWTLSFDEKL